MTRAFRQKPGSFFFDPQSADGLLLAVSRSDPAALFDALKSAGASAVEIGEAVPAGKPFIRVV